MGKIFLIAAFAGNRVIGKNEKIPWCLKNEQQHFKKLTVGNVVIMGRITFEEIYSSRKSILPDRINLVVSSSRNFDDTGALTFSSLQEAVDFARNNYPQKNIFIAGGESLYRQGILIADGMYLTRIELDAEGDRFFPQFSECDFCLESSEKASENQTDYFYQYYRRNK